MNTDLHTLHNITY